MMSRLVLVLSALALLGGCTVTPSSQSPSALSSAAWEQRNCETWGGYWNRTALVCEWKN